MIIPDGAGRAVMRWILAAFFAAAGYMHLAAPAALRPRLRITYVPRRGFGIP